jgi:hypothetical protein
MRKLKLKIKKWFLNTFVKRYLATIDASLLNLFTKEEKAKLNVSFGSNRANIERERILKILSSKKYKDFFFKAVRYDRNKPEETIKPYGDGFLDKIFNVVSTIYLYLFDRKLYQSIQLFKKWRNKISTVDTQVNDYLSNTTLDERADRAIILGVVDEKSGTAQKRMRKIQSSRVDKILVHNQN